MFNQNDQEKKLDWMYKGPNSLVEREEYLLGRAVDKTLEQINEEEKQKQQGVVVPKNRVEHECIPPSIRDFNKVVQAEQVDLSAKLQEDPLVAIKKREEESRRQFLQNPVQLKKLQKALKAQQARKNKKKKKKKKKSRDSDDSESDLEKKLAEKLLGKKSKKTSKEERNLDTILIHKYEEFKDRLTESDIQDILNGKITDSEDSSEDNGRFKKRPQRKRQDSSSGSEEDRKYNNNRNRPPKETYRREKRTESNDDDSKNIRKNISEKDNRDRRRDHSDDYNRYQNRSRSPHYKSSVKSNEKDKHKRRNSSSSSTSASENEWKKVKTSRPKKYDNDEADPDSCKNKRSYGLVNSDGVKIPLSKRRDIEKEENRHKPTKVPEPPPPVQKQRVKKLTEEEKEKLRREMMENAVWRDKERERNVKKYREKEEKERREQNFDPEFIHKQLLKSTHTSSVESRIKANVNNIQRSRGDMDRHFSKRE